MIREQDIISRYFTRKTRRASNRLGVGDDAAIIRIPAKQELLLSIDTLIEGVHFFKSTDPFALGHKTLAVSLSDIAAMGGKPIAALLSLSRPNADKKWLKAFHQGFFTLAEAYGVDLIGGDTCQGPLSLSSVVQGLVPQNQAVLRSGAKVGDLICVSGSLGDAAYAVQALKENRKKMNPYFLNRLQQPSPRVELGQRLRPYAHAMIDISDGLITDLKRILRASHVGASIYTPQLPLSSELKEASTPFEKAMKLALAGGDDYELCFTIPEKHLSRLKRLPTPITCIGKIEKKLGLLIRDGENKIVKISQEGYEHF